MSTLVVESWSYPTHNPIKRVPRTVAHEWERNYESIVGFEVKLDKMQCCRFSDETVSLACDENGDYLLVAN